MYNITHDDYAFVEKAGYEDMWVVRLKTGEFADTYYLYGSIRINEIEEPDSVTGDATGVLKFDYQIIETELDQDLLEQSVDFNNYIGAVLQHILEDSFEKGDYRIGDNDGKSGDDNPEESDQ